MKKLKRTNKRLLSLLLGGAVMAGTFGTTIGSTVSAYAEDAEATDELLDELTEAVEEAVEEVDTVTPVEEVAVEEEADTLEAVVDTSDEVEAEEVVEDEIPAEEVEETSSEEATEAVEVDGDYIMLNDMNYIVGESLNYGQIRKNVNVNGGTMKLMVNGKETGFLNGVSAHAHSTLVYDISSISNKLEIFDAYLGVDRAANVLGNGVKFIISVSDDNEN